MLQAFGRFHLLCVLRHGPFGAQPFNQQLADAVHGAGLISSSQGWYEGPPVMIARNDYSLGLINGDIGIAWRMPGPDALMRLYVVFAYTSAGEHPASTAGGDNTPIRMVLPSRLGELDTVYAMSVHKSQGLQFEQVALVLPNTGSNCLTREMLYSGITRAQ